MPLPNLIHPLTITIQKSDKASSTFDEDAREPIRSVARTAVTINAQVSMRGTSQEPDFGGLIEENVGGYLLFRVVDLTAKSYTPSIGDKITAIGHRTVELYILQSEDLAHYPGQSGATLVKAYFGDRRPAASTPSMVRVS
jgi:hypothetical protein